MAIINGMKGGAMNRNGVAAALGSVVVGFLLAMVSAGCAGYGNYPSGSGYLLMDSPNSPHMSEVIRKAVIAAVDRSAISGPYAVRLPAEMDQTRRGRLLAELGDHNARLVKGDEATGLPEFVVTRVIVRVNQAEVDVAIPVRGVAWPDGTEAQQLTTYYLKSGFGRWSVNRMRTWSVGVNERAIADIEAQRLRDLAGTEGDAVVVEETDGDGADEPPF
jgi:hypothetical protein